MLKTFRRPRGGVALRTLAVTPLLALALTACGSGDSNPSGGQQDSGAGSSSSATDWYLDYASCMRDAGIDIPDPGADGSLVTTRDLATDAGQAADAACRAELPEQPAPEGGDTGDGSGDGDAANLELAQCLRDLGYDVPDPEPGQPLGLDVPGEALSECGAGIAVPQ